MAARAAPPEIAASITALKSALAPENAVDDLDDRAGPGNPHDCRLAR
jgi:hypothetical protein